MSLTLFCFPFGQNSRAHKIIATAAFAGVKLEIGNIIGKNETDDYKRNCHPMGCHPVLQTADGYIFESNAIMRHIARMDTTHNLYGKTQFDASQVDMWLDFVLSEIDTFTHDAVLEKFYGKPMKNRDEWVKAGESVLSAIDLWMETRTFLVGERLTIADISVAFALQWAYCLVPEGEALSKKFKNTWRLYNTIMQQPQTVEVLKSVGGTFGIPPKAKEVKPKEVKPKEEKKKAKKDEDDEDEEAEMVVEKKPNPLDSLPPSKLVLDTWKRQYSNNDSRTVAAPWFFQNYDKEGYSCFWADYKYNDENKKQFMTANLVRGWFQRMEGNRKYAFGVALLIGTDSAHDLTSFWVFRGKGIPQSVLDVDDTELFDWKEADIEAEKERITDYLCWEGQTIPKPVLEGRAFK